MMMRRRRGPGLVATAVVVGGAAHMGAKSAQKQAAQQQAASQPVMAQPAAPAADDPMAEVQKLAELHTAGVLTDEEFAAAKAKALGI